MKFRKKPVEIEAMEFTNETKDQVYNFVTCNKSASFDGGTSHPTLKIQTLEGVMTARVGDWIIKGVNGEFYPCKPDIFEQTYVMDVIESGVICTKCGIGKVALMSTFVGDADLDDEPYTNGVAEGSNENIQFQDYVSLSIHACDSCGYVFDVFVE